MVQSGQRNLSEMAHAPPGAPAQRHCVDGACKAPFWEQSGVPFCDLQHIMQAPTLDCSAAVCRCPPQRLQASPRQCANQPAWGA